LAEVELQVFGHEGIPMAKCFNEAADPTATTDDSARLLAAFEYELPAGEAKPASPSASAVQPMVEPLSQRELEIMRLVADGFSNHEICEHLFLALDTVKGHNRKIFEKLQVRRRTEAVARARELGLI